MNTPGLSVEPKKNALIDPQPPTRRTRQSVFQTVSILSMTSLVLATACSAPKQRINPDDAASTPQDNRRCAGRTTPGRSGWKRYRTHGVYLDVDTSECGFQRTPIYLSSLGGTGHWLQPGGTSIYLPTATGFRIYLPTKNSPEDLEKKRWHINWDAIPKNASLANQCAGQTIPEKTDWVQYGSAGVYVTVDTSKCNLEKTPIYSTSLGGTGHWRTQGTTSIYYPKKDQFRVYLDAPGVTPEIANQRKWVINWSATPRGLQTDHLCTGETKQSEWKPYGKTSDTYYVNVDTSACGFKTTPSYITSLYGSRHWRTKGASAVYLATHAGFRVYMRGQNIPNSRLNWKASLTPPESQTECESGPCCSNGVFAPADHICRVADGVCDAPEYCTGESALCPDDAYAPSVQTCRGVDPKNTCDLPEFCPGDAPHCPPDTFRTSGHVCRPSLVGLGCDVEETCTGTSPACPPDGFAPSSKMCRAQEQGNACDNTEMCTGASPVCPEDIPLAIGTRTCGPDTLDLGLHAIGVTSYTTLIFGADAAELNRETRQRASGTAAAALLSGRNGLTQSWGMGGRFTFPNAVNLSDYGRVSYEIKSNHANPNISVAIELLVDSGGANESVWRQRESTQLRLSDIARDFKTVDLALNRDDFERTDGAHDTTFDPSRVSGIQFLMLIQPNTKGTLRQAEIYIDEIQFSEKSKLAGYETHRAPTIMAPETVATISDFDVGSTERPALLVTDPASSWLGLVHGMKSIGLPIRVTDDIQEALRHKVVWVYPAMPTVSTEVDRLRSHVQEGGILIAQEVRDTPMKEVFGFERATFARATDLIYSGKQISTLKFSASYPQLTGKLTDDREKGLPIYRSELGENMPTWRYSETKHPGIAVYSDSSSSPAEDTSNNVAITYNTFGNGKAYAFGLDVGLYALRGKSGRGGGLARDYINGFEPAIDVLFRLIRDIYVDANESTVTLSPLPNNHDLAVMLTHDIDTADSVVMGLEYAAMEDAMGVPATYFIQTKYITDAQESAFIGVNAFQALTTIQRLGMEVASHSVAHALNFNDLELGDGTEQFQSYQPVNVETVDSLEAIGGTVLGELRVSRSLLEDFVPGVQVKSFRPGHLRQPNALSQAMLASGYLNGSVGSAADSMTHLPYKMTYDRGIRSEVEVFDFPVTIEDERPNSPIVKNDVAEALRTAERISEKGGILVMLVHPNFLGEKLAFVTKFIEATKDKYLFTRVDDFGRWWAKRDAVELDSKNNGAILEVTLTVPRPMSGLTLEVPSGMVVSAKSQDVEITEIPDESRIVVTGEVSGELKLSLRKK